MESDTKKEKNRNNRSRLSSALLVILLLSAAFFVMADAPLVKSARDSLMQRLGYEAVNQGGHGNEEENGNTGDAGDGQDKSTAAVSLADLEQGNLPAYSGEHYVNVDGGSPEFPDDAYERAGLEMDDGLLTTKGSKAGKVDAKQIMPFEYYGSLDKLGRCTYAYGCLGDETMPEEGAERGDISSVHPSGWAKAQNWERCHLIAWALSAENANPQNLITGTHYLNYDGMRPLEEEVEHYIWNTGNHVLYMARPYFKGKELVARGVQLTAQSLEDKGRGISFNVYLFNVTPGSDIDYKTGVVTTEEQAAQGARVYIINTRSGVFHYPTCEGVKEMSEHNKKEVTATRKELTDQGYVPCGFCEP